MSENVIAVSDRNQLNDSGSSLGKTLLNAILFSQDPKPIKRNRTPAESFHYLCVALLVLKDGLCTTLWFCLFNWCFSIGSCW